MTNTKTAEVKTIKVVHACKYCEIELSGVEIKHAMRRCFDCIKAGAFHGI